MDLEFEVADVFHDHEGEAVFIIGGFFCHNGRCMRGYGMGSGGWLQKTCFA